MSGHSKWANIKRHKAKVDAVRGDLFSRLVKEIMAATKQGGPNPDTNFRLKMAIGKAKENNVPQANVDRAIRRASGQEEGVHYEDLVYEGYGPGGTAVYMEILTDNRNRTAGEIRHIFSRHGGALGETGCVAWMFEQKGRLIVSPPTDLSEEELLDMVIEAGADDLDRTEDEDVILTAPALLDQVRTALQEKGLEVSEAELVQLPKTTVSVSLEDAEKVDTLMQLLDDHDDVQKVYTNAEFPEEYGEESAD